MTFEFDQFLNKLCIKNDGALNPVSKESLNRTNPVSIRAAHSHIPNDKSNSGYRRVLPICHTSKCQAFTCSWHPIWPHSFFRRCQWITWRDILISTCERTLTPALCDSKWSLIVPLTSCPYNFNGMSSSYKISETITPSSNIPPVLSLALVAMPPQISAFKSLMITKSHSCQWQDCQVFQLERWDMTVEEEAEREQKTSGHSCSLDQLFLFQLILKDYHGSFSRYWV